MQRVVALWNSNWLGKVIIGVVGLLVVCCVIGVFTRGRTPPEQAIVPGAALGSRIRPTTNAPTVAPRPTAAPKPTQTLVPTFTPMPTLTPNPNINHAGVKPLNKNTCPDDYPIKGNIGSNGKLYHVIGDRSYKATNPERCFASVTDAKAAGFSAPAN